MVVEIREVSPADTEVRELFKLLDAHNMSHCPPEICHLTRPEELERADALLLGVYSDGILCGMGGLKFFENYAEVTRMFVKEAYRGNKIGVHLLKELESRALQRDMTALKLETSEKFKNAFRLYKKAGFRLCEPFGEYIDKPHNTYMEKKLGKCR